FPRRLPDHVSGRSAVRPAPSPPPGHCDLSAGAEPAASHPAGEFAVSRRPAPPQNPSKPAGNACQQGFVNHFAVNLAATMKARFPRTRNAMQLAQSTARSLKRAEATDRRRHRRVQWSVRVRGLTGDGEEFQSNTVDVCAGGHRINLARPLTVGENLVLYIDEIGRVEGVVARV